MSNQHNDTLFWFVLWAITFSALVLRVVHNWGCTL